jgi:hypothetical protein
MWGARPDIPEFRAARDGAKDGDKKDGKKASLKTVA